jgi:3-oxoadipate enol-lactonase
VCAEPATGVVAPRGVEIAWHEEGTGPALLMLHGVGSSMESFDAMAARLSSRFRVLRYDLRGHGASGKPPGPYSLADYVDDAVDLLDARGISGAHALGFSFGGLIAQALALAAPQRVHRLVLVSSVAGRTPQEQARMHQRAETLDREGATGTVEAALERWFTPAFRERHPEVVEARRARALANDPRGYAAAYRVFATSDMDQELAGISAPTLVMTGEHDVGSTPRMARLIHERVAGSRLEILDGLRHLAAAFLDGDTP